MIRIQYVVGVIAILLVVAGSGVASDSPVSQNSQEPKKPRRLAEVLADSVQPAESIVAYEPAHLRTYLQGNPRHGWAVGQLGKPAEFWNQKIIDAPVDGRSKAVTDYLSYVSRKDKNDPSTEFFGQFDLGKKANGELYSFTVLEADNSTPMYKFKQRLQRSGFEADDFWSPHCDAIKMPVPPGGRLQNEAAYECTGNGDCHLYVVNSENGRLYEQWHANNPGPKNYSGGCANYWDLTEIQPDKLRGLSCTSANAAGIPYIPLLVTPGEIKAGEIRHALAFTLPNGWVQRDLYVRPATHNPVRSPGWGRPSEGPGEPMIYGSRLRLRADFAIDPSWPPALRVVLKALQAYGMLHIDGGPRFIVASNDALSEHDWDDADIALDPFLLSARAQLSWTDFEVVSDYNNTGSMAKTRCRRRAVRR